ncbi:sacsin N-terminal ATP-binding-like domain-containing protein [Erythrobacter sp. BLCC-B19]|uniref:sacsin N-terminal ATP-binding-like domain-containing protein n=1 Tax=Erythrobacter sp. BLCC-B19 TaxID=3025315 RepID=UPI00235EA59D|nr:hypothetical protein [Erythrobacter sp. BLCC-B19]WDA41427.1 hypothetical protein PS060_01050 [Erythrobacter sp. BLCC-B19]
MTAYQTPQTAIVTELKNLLRDRYRSGFPVFKELIQNADDAKARRIVICGHSGFNDARNPLLQAPGLIIANDGPVTNAHFDALNRSSGGTKGGDAASVGRFGLGQKAIFHLCDAFLAQARLVGPNGPAAEPRLQILNPLEEIPAARNAGEAWRYVEAVDVALLDDWAKANEMDGGMVIAVPLRSKILTPGGGLSLTRAEWTPESAIDELINSEELSSVLCCLRNISVLDIVQPQGNTKRYERQGAFTALSSPNTAVADRRLTGSFNGPQGLIHFCGRETRLTSGHAISLKERGDWPTTFDLYDEPVRADAEPHGAVIVCRRMASDNRPRLRIRDVVYLPVGEPLLDLELPVGSEIIELLLHGHFFVSSDRRSINSEDGTIESLWNETLRREATLPLILDALADGFAALDSDQERYALVHALTARDDRWWWMKNAADACRGRALARCWAGSSTPAWQVVQADGLRPVPVGTTTTLPRLKEAIPSLEAWCTSRGLTLCFGTVLAETAPTWPDSELAEIVRKVGPAAFTKGPVAETIGALLEGQAGPLTREALADQFRLACSGVDQSFAAADRLKAVVRHLPPEQLLFLPPSIDSRPVIAALAAAALPVKSIWLDGPVPLQPTISLSKAVALLSALEPQLIQGGQAGLQAATMVGQVLRNGPRFEELARNETGRYLKVIPAHQMQNSAAERLSLETVLTLQNNGLLFDAGPNPKLDLLAEAVAAPAIYRLDLRDGGIEGCASTNRKESLVAVVQRAQRYGDPARCGELAEFLRDHASVDDLRRLITQDTELGGDVELIELTGFSEALDQLVDRLCPDRQARFISSATAKELHKVRDKVGLKPLDITLLGHWLDDARCQGTLPPIDAATAQALLQSTIDDAVLRHLPLNRSVHDDTLHPATALFLGQRAQVPASLASFARLADLWPDQAASARQNRLIDKWGPNAIIRTALAAPDPDKLTAEICEAIKATGNIGADLTDALRDTAWIGANGKAWQPAQVLELPTPAENVWAELIGTNDGLLCSNQLPASLRDETVRERLAGIMPDRQSSFALAFQSLAEAHVGGLCLDAALHLEDLRRIARAGDGLGMHAMGSGIWTLLASALTEDFPDTDLIALAGTLPRPEPATVLTQMNALAGLAERGANEQVARRLHLAGFKANIAELKMTNGHLPADLLVPNGNDNFVRADTVTHDAAALASEALLERRYAACVDVPDVSALTDAELDSQMPLAQALERAFGPLVKHDVGDGILLALAMTGRGEETRELASLWQGQLAFDRIAYDLDQVPAALDLDPTALPKRLEELRFEVRFPDGGMAWVRSIAGTLFKAPLSGRGDALLIQCRQRERTRQDIDSRVVVWELVLGHVDPNSADEAKALLRQFVHDFAPALLLAWPQQRQALLDLLDRYLGSDQVSLEDARHELREVLHDRLEGIRTGNVIRQAVAAYHRAKYSDPEAARDGLWEAAQSPQGAAELLEAMRTKIKEMGYRPDRVLFELYQNAVDAQVQWDDKGKVRVQVEAKREEDGRLDRIRLIHWGRPINQPGPDRQKAEREGHERDLAHMLAVSHSAKEGDAITGRFGLGFKTVHMLSDSVGLASAGVTLRIAGGMLPIAWEEGEAEAGPYNDRGRKATLIDIPIAADHRPEAEAAWEAFCDAAPLLAALGRSGEIKLIDGTQEPACFGNDVRELISGVAGVALDRGRQALRFDLAEGFRLFVAIGRNGPYALLRDVAQFWHLVPLVGVARKGAWLMEGPFPVDPGRSHFSGSAQENEALFARLGQRLAERLIALHEASETNWDDLASKLGIAPDSKDAFWQALIGLFVPDLESGEPQRELHGQGRGLALLMAQCPVVPLAFGGTARAADISWRLDGALAFREVHRLLQEWSALDPWRESMISKDTADLLGRLDLPRGKALDLPKLIELVAPEIGIDPALAELLSPAIDEELRAAASKEEDEALRSILRERNWKAQDGSWQPIRLLAFPQSDDPDERARADFASAAGRLALDYSQDGLKLAMFAREQAGHNEAVWKGWARSATASQERQRALLCYLVDADQRTVNVLTEAATWLPTGAALADYPLLQTLEYEARMRLLAKLGYYGTSPSAAPGAVLRTPTDAETALLEIADWWKRERAVLIPAYERSVYPEDGFSFDDLQEDSAEAWFTLLALATFQTLGRIKPDQSRSFVTNAMTEGWWHRLSTINPAADNLEPFVDRLRAWSEPDAREDYMIWRRCLTDLCLIARHLDDYRKLFRKLPAIIQQEGPVSLGNQLRPGSSPAAGRMGIFAPPLTRSLGIGANWVLRELARKGIYSQAQAEIVLPYGWSTADRVRRLMQRLGTGSFDHGVDAGRNLHDAVHCRIGDEARFNGDGDLPLHIITLAKHRDRLNNILYNAVGEGWSGDDLDEDKDDDA